MALHTFAALVTPPVLVAILLLDPFLKLWIGNQVSPQSAEVGRILLIGFWANAFALIPYTRLQASGRPDLVTKALLVEIPPYMFGLWAGLTYLGIVGSAIAFCVRCIADFCILAWMVDRKVKYLGVLTSYFLALLVAATVSTFWTMADGLWWVSSGLSCVAVTVLGWKTLPASIKRRLEEQTSLLLQKIAR